MTVLRVILSVALLSWTTLANADPLPSWNEGAAKERIIAFVENVTDPASADFVPESDRTATFDNDGTLWSEMPLYFQFMFALDRLREMAKADPSILKTEALKAANAGDMKALLATGEKGLLEVIAVTHSGMTVTDFIADAREWLATAEHPTKKRRFDTMVFQPMLELLSYLRDQGFKTYIVSGGGIDFMRAFANRVYNVPPEQVIGSTGKAKYEVHDGKPVIMKDPGIAFIDDKDGKPIAIYREIGRPPIFAAGNSDGDFQMLEYTTTGASPRLGLIVHHTDAVREWAYDRDSHIGTLSRGLDEAEKRGWLLVDMKTDWKVVYPELP